MNTTGISEITTQNKENVQNIEGSPQENSPEIRPLACVKQHTLSEADHEDLFGHKIRRDIQELIDEENQDSSDRLRDDLDDDGTYRDDDQYQISEKYYPPVSKIDTQT